MVRPYGVLVCMALVQDGYGHAGGEVGLVTVGARGLASGALAREDARLTVAAEQEGLGRDEHAPKEGVDGAGRCCGAHEN